ncbi:hypothetical protein GOBAR_DD07163 [Gossypium barbadense]|nr:hypothetical protein GOBAR_DD07163 [Gossypium barbadense]
MDVVSEDIDDEGDEGEDVHPSSVGNSSCGIVIRNNLGAHMLSLNTDATHATDFLEYADIILAQCLAEYMPSTIIDLQTLSCYGLDHQLQPGRRIFHQIFWTFDPCVWSFPHCKSLVSKGLVAVRRSKVLWRDTYARYELELHQFRHKLERLEADMVGNIDAKNEAETSESIEGRTCIHVGGGASAGGSRPFVIRVHMSMQYASANLNVE